MGGKLGSIVGLGVGVASVVGVVVVGLTDAAVGVIGACVTADVSVGVLLAAGVSEGGRALVGVAEGDGEGVGEDGSCSTAPLSSKVRAERDSITNQLTWRSSASGSRIAMVKPKPSESFKKVLAAEFSFWTSTTGL